MKSFLLRSLGALLACLWLGTAQASVIISATRVIYPAQEREVTVQLSNQGRTPALVQAWLDTGDASAEPHATQVPFSISPAMFRLDPDKGQALRLIHSREPLPNDRESLFWLNVLEIPPRLGAEEAGGNHLQMAIRQRIKVMFRPAGLPGSAVQALQGVQWTLLREGRGWQLQADNRSPFYVNLGEVNLVLGARSYAAGAGFVAPFGQQRFAVEGAEGLQPDQAQVSVIAINDHGAGVPLRQALSR
ncbi:MAG: fimbria/pilus periplasmic chaperone [Pseudomonas sp.]|uniref:fimbrial biogenesis chaperone n=1 Tax=Pseudomonas abieticivorans TaxID=2931382 RepID=UPI0020C0FDBE|nr:fimbria/pilus periplasmic chaperone [Pseudomonas sp. PIA16]MDE1167961.1 fimbria/pilus periplasmic chaperone [Pseudomonas sp.]